MVMYHKSGLLLLILLIVASLALAACGGSDSKNEVSQDEANGSADTSLPQTFMSANGVTLRYPQSWVARDLVEGPLVYAVVANSQAVLDDLDSDAPGQMPAGGFFLTINTVSWADLAAALGVSDVAAVKSVGVMGVMEMFYTPVDMTPSDGDSFQFGNVEAVTIGTIEAARASFIDSDTKSYGFNIAYEFDDDWLAWIQMQALEGELAGFEGIAYEIIESITYNAPAG